MALQDPQGLLDSLVVTDHLVFKDPLEIKALQDNPDRQVKMADQVPLDLLVDLANLGHQDRTDHLVPWARLVSRVPLELRVTMAHLDQLVIMDPQVLLDHKGLWVPWEIQVL